MAPMRRSRRRIVRKRRPLRRTFRRRRFPRRIKNNNRINTKFVVEKSFDPGTPADGQPPPVGFNITLNDLTTDQTTSVQAFSYYKINAVKFEVWPQTNTYGNTAGYNISGSDPATGTITSTFLGSNTTARLLSLFSSNRDEDYTSYDALVRNPRHKTHSPFYPFKRFTRITPTIDVAMGGTGVSLRAGKMYISTGDPGATYGRFFLAVKQPEISNELVNQFTAWSVRITYYVSLKNLNNN